MTKDELDLRPIEERLNNIGNLNWVIRERKTSEGKFIIYSEYHHPGRGDNYGLEKGHRRYDSGRRATGISYQEDAEFIANAPCDIANLLDEVKRLRESLKNGKS